MECIKFWLEHDEKHNFNMETKYFYRLSKYAYFLIFFTKIFIIRVLSLTDKLFLFDTYTHYDTISHTSVKML